MPENENKTCMHIVSKRIITNQQQQTNKQTNKNKNKNIQNKKQTLSCCCCYFKYRPYVINFAYL